MAETEPSGTSSVTIDEATGLKKIHMKSSSVSVTDYRTCMLHAYSVTP